MKFRRITDDEVVSLSDEEALDTKNKYRVQGELDLYTLLNETNLDESEKAVLEVEYMVESNMKLNQTVDQYKSYIQKLITRIYNSTKKGD